MSEVPRGVVEGHPERLDVKVNGVAGAVALGPAKVFLLSTVLAVFPSSRHGAQASHSVGGRG